jgi:hypothetical protein
MLSQSKNINLLIIEFFTGSVIAHIDPMNCPLDIKCLMQEHIKSIQVVVKKSDDILESIEASGIRTNNNCQNRIFTFTSQVEKYGSVPSGNHRNVESVFPPEIFSVFFPMISNQLLPETTGN